MKVKEIYLVAYYHAKPKDPRRTKEPGYMLKTENISYDESLNITRGLKTKDRQSANVILNLTAKEVIRNTFNQNTDFASLLSYYQEGYPKYINPLVAQLYKEEVNDVSVDVQNEKEKEGS